MQVAQRPQRRGAEIFAAQLNAALARQGHVTCTVYLYPFAGKPRLDPTPADYLLNGNERHFSEKLPGINPALLRRLLRSIGEFSPDLIQVNGARTVKYGAFAKRLSTKKPLLVYRNIDNPTYWVRDRLRLWFYRYAVMPQVDGTVGVSETTLRTVLSLYGSHAPAQFIPNGIDTRALDDAPNPDLARRQLGADADAPIVLFAGNLAQQKRPDRFLRMLSLIREHYPHVQGWLLGDGPMRHELESYTAEMGMANTVRFLGYQTHIASYMSAADLLVITSDSDGIPAVLLEAGYLGTPAVATRVGGMDECILHGETGLLVDREDEAALAAAVARLLGDPVERARLGANAQRWIADRFTMEIVAAQYVEFFNRLLQ